MRKPVILFLIGAAALGAMVMFLAHRYPGALSTDADQAALVRAVGILVLVCAGVFWAPRLNLKGALRNAMIWAAIVFVVLAGYAFREDFQRVGDRIMGEVVPHSASVRADGSVEVKRDQWGQFQIEARVNGTPVVFLVDTGASITTLSQKDAARVGFDPAELDFTLRFSTANGTAWGAPVRLESFGVGPIAVNGMRAAVGAEGLTSSLLGMNFLSRLSGYRVSGNTLTLTP